jgi:RNase P/RNase MRP subunit p29
LNAPDETKRMLVVSTWNGKQQIVKKWQLEEKIC